MTFLCGCCGAEVVGRLVLVCIALGVREFVERCPACRETATFRPEAEGRKAVGRAA